MISNSYLSCSDQRSYESLDDLKINFIADEIPLNKLTFTDDYCLDILFFNKLISLGLDFYKTNHSKHRLIYYFFYGIPFYESVDDGNGSSNILNNNNLNIEEFSRYLVLMNISIFCNKRYKMFRQLNICQLIGNSVMPEYHIDNEITSKLSLRLSDLFSNLFNFSDKKLKRWIDPAYLESVVSTYKSNRQFAKNCSNSNYINHRHKLLWYLFNIIKLTNTKEIISESKIDKYTDMIRLLKAFVCLSDVLYGQMNINEHMFNHVMKKINELDPSIFIMVRYNLGAFNYLV